MDADKAKLSQYASHLNQEKHILEQTNKTLAQENQQLRNQSAAVLAAHLVKQKEEQKKSVSAQQPRAEQPVTVAKAAAEVAQPKPATQPKPAAQPKQAQAQAKVTTEADLPEIKVADPIPQPEFDDGEDFLEKTDTFIGRIKWSVFHEDK